MSKLLITTQVHENYGDDQVPQWKAKGGREYVIRKFRGGDNDASFAVMSLRDQIEHDADGYREQVIGWNIVANDYLTEYEQSQMRYDGEIKYSPKELTW